MKYKEPFMEMLVFMQNDVITGSPGDLGEIDGGGSGNIVDEGIEYTNIN